MRHVPPPRPSDRGRPSGQEPRDAAGAAFVAGCVLALIPQSAQAHSRGSGIGTADPWLIAWALGLLVVFEMIFVAFVVRLRNRRAGGTDVKSARRARWLEVLWVVAPLVLVMAMFLAATLGNNERVSPDLLVMNATPPRGALAVEVSGRQFQWDFHYPSEHVDSRTELHIPVGRDVAMVLESKDVIHSFDIPSLGLRHDLLPGRRSTLSFRVTAPGRYPIVCSALCGRSTDRDMPGVLVVEETSAFQEWLARARRGTP